MYGSAAANAAASSRCHHCDEQSISLFIPSQKKRIIQHNFFHEVCHDCDDTASQSQMQLCASCQHHRIRHVFGCMLKRLPDLVDLGSLRGLGVYVIFQPEDEDSAHCDFCRFLISCAGERRSLTKEVPPGSNTEHRSYSLCIRQRAGEQGAEQGVFHMYGPTGSTIICTTQRGEEQRRVQEYIDWKWLTGWLQDKKPQKSSLQPELRGVRVIDVFEKCVKLLRSEQEYVALSYVWGSMPQGRVQCLKDNVERLSLLGALSELELPRTIKDALMACQQLGFRFLWVDSLCITQDGPHEEITAQLDQMANIYNRATLTLVAATGNSAAQGLAGVSYARDARQYPLVFYDGFEFFGSVPSLRTCMYESTWSTRGWTYQEYVASQRLLFFTDCGLYLKDSFGVLNQKANSEGATGQIHNFHEDALDLRTVETFTQRSLTYPSDVLRASAGVLQMLYKDRLFFGMPMDEFDSAMLWVPTKFGHRPRPSSESVIFPSWSWASSSTSVKFPRRRYNPFGLARWGEVSSIPGSDKDEYYIRDQISPDGGQIRATIQPNAFAHAGIAWLSGCVESEAPPDVLPNTSTHEYGSRLKKRWPQSHVSFWADAHSCYEDSSIFNNVSKSSLTHSGCLAVRAQVASFTLDTRGQVPPHCPIAERKSSHEPPICDPKCVPVLIRTGSHTIAGTIELDDFTVHNLRVSNDLSVQFLALSVDNGGEHRDEMFLTPYANHYFDHLSVSAFYGCACSRDAASPKHIVECPHHSDFEIPEPVRQPTRPDQWMARPFLDDKDHKTACSHFLAQQSYYNEFDGETLHDDLYPPFLWVMMIAPSGERGLERMGISEAGDRQDMVEEVGGGRACFPHDCLGMIRESCLALGTTAGTESDRHRSKKAGRLSTRESHLHPLRLPLAISLPFPSLTPTPTTKKHVRNHHRKNLDTARLEPASPKRRPPSQGLYRLL